MEVASPDRRQQRRTRMRRHEDRQRVFRNATAYFIVLLVLFIGAVLFQRATNHRLTGAIRGSCLRLQLVRDDANVQASNVYELLQGVNEGASPAVIRRRLADVDPATRRLITTLLEAGARTKGVYPRILDDTFYGPPTDCAAATRHPETYRPPPLVPFASVAGCFDARTNRRPMPECRQ